MSRRKKKNSRRPRPADALSRVPRIASPEKRLAGSFTLLDEVSQAADLALHQYSGPTDPMTRLDLQLFVRGVNALKAVRVLTENAHWEVAAAPTRQLFELVLNVECLNAHEDRDAAALRFVRFGALQTARLQLAHLEYDVATGRAADARRRQELSELLDSGLWEDFKDKPRADGSTRWANHWNRKSARDLAEASPSPHRSHQYNLLFTAWSEEAHAAPGALVDAFMRDGSAGWVELAVADDDLNVAQTHAMALMLFLELWGLLPGAPHLDIEESQRWIERLRAWTVENVDVGHALPAPPSADSAGPAVDPVDPA